MECVNCHEVMKTTYIREQVNGKYKWINSGHRCNTCDLFIDTKDLKVLGKLKIPSYTKILDDLKRDAIRDRELYGYLDERATRRDKNVIRLFYMYLTEKYFEVEYE